MDTETRSSLNSKSFLYTIRPMHLSDEPKNLQINEFPTTNNAFLDKICLKTDIHHYQTPKGLKFFLKIWILQLFSVFLQ